MIIDPAPLDAAGLHRLLAWTSPAYPVGAFGYSHGLEAAAVACREQLIDYVEAVLTRGGGWTDAILFVHSWQAGGETSGGAFDALAELAAAFRATSETALESHQQGRSFLAVTRRAWPHAMLDDFAGRWGDRPIAHVSVLALACAAHRVPLMPALQAFLHGIAANLVSAGVRLVPLGATDGQIAMARLSQLIAAIADRACAASLDDLGTAAPRLELCSMAHETQYMRLFRS